MALADVGVNPRSVFVTNDGAVIQYLVENGEMVALLPSSGIQAAIQESRLARIHAPELESEFDVYMIWKKGRKSPVIKSFVRHILDFGVPGIVGKKTTGEDS